MKNRLLRGIAVALLPLVIFTFGSCGQRAVTGESSPVMKSYAVNVSNKGAENTQVVTVAIEYDRPIKVTGKSREGLKITLNGKAPDPKTMDYRVKQDKADSSCLIVELYALKADADPAKGRYFALYEGNLTLAGAGKDAALLGVTDATGKYTALLKKFNCFIPSGVALQTVSAVTGNVAGGIKAKTVLKLTDIARVRVITWLSLLSGGKPVLEKSADTSGYGLEGGYFPLHAHEFLKYKPDEYAKLIVEALGKYYGKDTPTEGKYLFSCNADTVTIEAATVTDGETLSLAQSPAGAGQSISGETS